MESIRTTSATYYNAAKRWMEDAYLSCFGESRTSYGIKGMVDQSVSRKPLDHCNTGFAHSTRVIASHQLIAVKCITLTTVVAESLQPAEGLTGNETVDGAQKAVVDAIGDTFGKKRVAATVGEAVDKGLLRGNA